MRRIWAAAVAVMAWTGCTAANGDLGPGPQSEAARSADDTNAPAPDQTPAVMPMPTDAMARPPRSNFSSDQLVQPTATKPTPPPEATFHAPVMPSETATPVQAGAEHWTFLSGSNGLPSRIYGVSADEGGNLWVAGGASGVFVMKAGESQFRGYGTPYPAMSIAGGPAGVAFVGYQGLPDCDMAWDTGGSPEVYKSGDADRVWLEGGDLKRAHYDIYSGPGVVAAEPAGREKLCNIWRILYDAKTKSVWFGGNHGVAWGDPETMQVVEHTHPAINGYMRMPDGTLHYTLLSGDYYGLATDATGNLWLGGRERSAWFPYAQNGGNFWKGDEYVQQHKVDVWPDAVPQDPTPDQAVLDDTYGFAPMPDGRTWVGSQSNGVALLDQNHAPVAFFVKPLVEKAVTAMAYDPANDSMWAGHLNGGLTRLVGTQWVHFKGDALGGWANSRVYDVQIQKVGPNGKRRVLVAFLGGGIGIYDGD